MAALMLVRAIRNDEPMERIRELIDEAVKEKSLNQRNNEGQANAGMSALEAGWEMVYDDPEKGKAILHLLLDRGADASSIIDVQDIAELGDQALFDKFIAHGMNIDIPEQQRLRTPLIYGLLEYSELLGYRGNRAETSATGIRVILGKNPDVELQDKNGDSALHLAMGNSTHFIMEILPRLITPNTINLQNNRGMTPLMQYAARELFQLENDEVGQEEFVNFLVEHGANVMERNNTGQTAREIAIFKNNQELASILQQKEQEVKESAQGAVVQRGRQGHQQRVPPAIARRITNFLGGKRRTRKGRKGRKGQKAKTRKGRKTHARRRK